MKNPLHYQLSECDCGPTALLNGLSYLFQREEIPPEVIRNVMLYCLDCYNDEGIPCKSGTSMAAMIRIDRFLCRFSIFCYLLFLIENNQPHHKSLPAFRQVGNYTIIILFCSSCRQILP